MVTADSKLTCFAATITVYSRGLFYAENVTCAVEDAIVSHHIISGTVTCTLQHTTSTLMLMEYEIGILYDIKALLERLAPQNRTYAHHRRGVDTNGAAHLLSSMSSHSVTVPIRDNQLVRGQYQDIVFMDFQKEIRPSTIALHVMGLADEPHND